MSDIETVFPEGTLEFYRQMARKAQSRAEAAERENERLTNFYKQAMDDATYAVAAANALQALLDEVERMRGLVEAATVELEHPSPNGIMKANKLLLSALKGSDHD